MTSLRAGRSDRRQRAPIGMHGTPHVLGGITFNAGGTQTLGGKLYKPGVGIGFCRAFLGRAPTVRPATDVAAKNKRAF